MQHRIAGLDALRGLAALGVFVCHLVAYWTFLNCPHAVMSLSQVGAHGVDIFVVLSGFVLALPVPQAGTRLIVRSFYGRRFWRILPVYWVAVLIAAVLAMAPTWSLLVAAPASAWDLIAHMFGLQTVFVPTLGTINGSLWSVSLELTLYATFPLVLMLIRKAGPGGALAATALLAIVWNWMGTSIHLGGPFGGLVGDSHSLPMRLVQFSAGACLAGALNGPANRYFDPSAPNFRRAVLMTVPTLIIATVVSTMDAPTALKMDVWALAGCALVWLFALSASSTLVRGLDVLGTRTYSFYLIHQPIVLLCGAAARHLPGPHIVIAIVGGIVCLVLVAVAAEVLYRSIERPSHRLARRKYPHFVERLERQSQVRV